MTLRHLGECCNEVNIQSDDPASVLKWDKLGDYKKYGNDSNVYKNIMDSTVEKYLYKNSNGDWVVCTNWQYRLLQNLAIL
jgi:hypothetical protein